MSSVVEPIRHFIAYDPLGFLLAFNTELADGEATMKPVIGQGLPPVINDATAFITDDCIRADSLPIGQSGWMR
jgi:hypothetical protein